MQLYQTSQSKALQLHINQDSINKYFLKSKILLRRENLLENCSYLFLQNSSLVFTLHRNVSQRKNSYLILNANDIQQRYYGQLRIRMDYFSTQYIIQLIYNDSVLNKDLRLTNGLYQESLLSPQLFDLYFDEYGRNLGWEFVRLFQNRIKLKQEKNKPFKFLITKISWLLYLIIRLPSVIEQIIKMWIYKKGGFHQIYRNQNQYKMECRRTLQEQEEGSNVEVDGWILLSRNEQRSSSEQFNGSSEKSQKYVLEVRTSQTEIPRRCQIDRGRY